MGPPLDAWVLNVGVEGEDEGSRSEHLRDGPLPLRR
jgi:hypothetical protein